MNLKENFQKLSNQKKNIYYWAGFILSVDVALALFNVVRFSQTGQCRNYMYFNSLLHSCSFLEFARNGWAWISFVDIFLFVPAAAVMIFATKVVDSIFVKKD